MRLDYVLHDGWPPLAWLAGCSRSSNSIAVHHGRGVEIREDWFCEAVWDGPFSDGDFDETDVVAGSGGRVRDGRVVFVSSASTVDRLQYFERGDDLWVSNSLACLLRHARAELDPTYADYYTDFYTIVQGIDRYHKQIETSRGPATLTYFYNIEWCAGALREIPKLERGESFSSFEQYVTFVRECFERVADNCRDRERTQTYELLSTLSSGYDSTTVSTLAREVGCRRAITFGFDFRGEHDAGDAVAKVLGIDTITESGNSWRTAATPEVPFLAANAMGEEVRFQGVETHLVGKVLLTGYHGDKVWSKDTKSLGSDIVRGDPSGLGLTEYRLWAGFIHCPVPFWGVRRIRDLHAISNSPSMEPWDVGGDYSRPICRRICEEAGIPRESFGVRKRNASVILHNYNEMLTPASLADYFAWLRENRSSWIRAGRFPPIPSATLDRISYAGARRSAEILRKLPYFWRFAHRLGDGPIYLRRYVFPWALERAKQRYD